MKREVDSDSSVETAEKVQKTMTGQETGDQESAFINPSTERPDRETQLYDRQLRLWNKSGQKKFQEGCVGICDCSATSGQIAKNLVLGGIKSIAMVDNKIVRQSDIGSNFFLDQASLGKPRVQESPRLLKELTATDEDPFYLNDVDLYSADYFDGLGEINGLEKWTALICVRLIESSEEITFEHCWKYNCPIISVQTCGLVACIRIQLRELSVIETHPESLADLRLDSPFPALTEFVKSFEMDTMDSHEHSHIPAVVLIIHFLELFKSKHDGKLPQDSTQRAELKKMILAEKRNSDEDNFDEAVGMIWKACQPTKIPGQIEELFKDPHCDKVPWFEGQFWLLVRSLREFVERNPSHQLPLSGVLPDMKSDTKNFIKMQSIYCQQALQDLETFKKIVEEMRGVLDNSDLSSTSDDDDESNSDDEHDGPDLDPSDETVETFVKNCAHIRLIRGAQYNNDHPKDLIPKFMQECEPDNEEYTVTWYIAFQAMAKYRSDHHGEYPGMRKGQEDQDFNSLSEIALNYLHKKGWKLEEKIVPEKMQKALKEIVRSAGSEIPHISSLVGGLVSQEIIKLITGQYIPINGICIFDGYKSSTGILQF
ncbi:hypothetical protein MJO28_004389 [Puccinia striiformis f. sp. tritici]|uniref:Uncharacterized protein n=1 Tax=Puccinia striiformis f. sp. tritici TaxID=168172 RepID=A0ACC0EP94_9BASI|nr:hypothetical protein MJO28_004389 [Puccinia striiformis f. sp. tritici]